MPVDVLLYTSDRIHRTVVSLNTVFCFFFFWFFFFGISTLPPTVAFPARTTLHLRAFFIWSNNSKEFYIYVLLAANEEHCMLHFGKLFLFLSYFSSQMKFREFSVKEKKISIFDFF